MGKGAKINQPNAQRQLPLEIAVQNNAVGIVNTLLCLPKTTYSRDWDPVLNLQISIDEINNIIQMVPKKLTNAQTTYRSYPNDSCCKK